MTNNSRCIKNICAGLLSLLLVGSIVLTIVMSHPAEPACLNRGGSNATVENQGKPMRPQNSSSDMEQMNREKPPEKPTEAEFMPTRDSFGGCSPNAEAEVIYYVALAIESLLLTTMLVYLVMSHYNQKTFKETFVNTDKTIIFCALSLLIAIILTLGEFIIVSKIIDDVNNPYVINGPREEQKDKDTKAEDVDKGEELTTRTINLNEYDSNITITEAGEYTISGGFEHAILVNASAPVKLILNNATIKNSNTAAIANISTNDLVVELASNSVNTLADGGSSEYDACIYSMGKLTILGDGSLELSGNQEEGEGIATETQDIVIDGGKINITSVDDGINAGGDGGTITINNGEIFIKAGGDGIDSNKDLVINGGNIYTIGSSTGGDAGIDTDGGFAINGGEVIALGSDMLEAPKNNSTQYSISLSLGQKVDSGARIELKDSSNNVVMSFEARESFRTLVLSNDKISKGVYTLEINGSPIKISGQSNITVENIVTNLK